MMLKAKAEKKAFSSSYGILIENYSFKELIMVLPNFKENLEKYAKLLVANGINVQPGAQWP